MKGIIFDLDGTMVDNMMVHHRAWQKKLAELGLVMEMDEVMEKVHGINEQILERLFGDRFNADERKRIAQEKEEVYRSIFLPQLELIAGLDNFLARLTRAQIPIGIGSAAPPENVDFVLDNLKIRDLFRVVFHSRDVVNGKPDPEIYHKVAGGLQIPTEECLIFEDSPIGALAASRAGSKVIVVTTTHTPDEFRDIPNIIKFINNYHEIDSEVPGLI